MQDVAANEERRADAGAAGHLSVLRELVPYIWPAGRPDLRMRVVLALIALIVAKASHARGSHRLQGDRRSLDRGGERGGDHGARARREPVFLIIAYGVGRVLMVLFAQFRDVWFTAVAQNAVRDARQPHLPPSA